MSQEEYNDEFEPGMDDIQDPGEDIYEGDDIEQPDDDGEGSEEGSEYAESLSEVGDDWRIEVPVGDEVRQLTAAELQEQLNRAQQLDALEQSYRQLQEQSNMQRSLAEYVSKDPLIAGIIQNRYQNGDDAEFISKYFGGKMSPNNAAAEQEDDLPGLDPEVERVLSKKYLEPIKKQNEELQQKLQQITTEQTQRDVYAHNQTVMDGVIEEYGINWDNSPEQAAALRKAKDILYPDLDLRTQRLNKAQAAALFAQAQIPSKPQSKRTSTTDRVRAATKAAKSAPKVVSGNKGQGRLGREANATEKVSQRDRLERFKEMFG